MDNDSINQQNLTEEQRQLVQLQSLLSETLAAERFFETASGRLIEQLINKRVNISLRKLTGEDFLKDHTGFVNENAWLRANQRLLRELQVAASPVRRDKLVERIENANDE